MANINLKNALDKSLRTTKQYIDDKVENYTSIENIDYDTLLAFDTSEIVFESSGEVTTSSVLGKAKLNRLILK